MPERAFFPPQHHTQLDAAGDAALSCTTDICHEPLTDHNRQLGFVTPAAQPHEFGHRNPAQRTADLSSGSDFSGPLLQRRHGTPSSSSCSSSTLTATSLPHVDGAAAAHGPFQLQHHQRAPESGNSAGDDDDSLKAEILSHPLYPELLRAHVLCLSSGLPPDCATSLESQLVANQHSVAINYLVRAKTKPAARAHDPQFEATFQRRAELDNFMESYLQQLLSLKKQLEHLLIPLMEKTMDTFLDLEQALWELTGEMTSRETKDLRSLVHDEVEGMGITPFTNAWDTSDQMQDLSHDEVDMKVESQVDQTLLHFIRDELKNELKQSYLENLTTMREEILKKRRASKLPGDITVLKKWWNAHSKWPYPTEEEKRQMVEASGLDLRQINNWFINHRKRNWTGRAVPMQHSSFTAGECMLHV